MQDPIIPFIYLDEFQSLKIYNRTLHKNKLSMKFRNIRQLKLTSHFSDLPDFLRILHPQHPEPKPSNQIKSEPSKPFQPDQWLEDIIKNQNITFVQPRDQKNSCNRNAYENEFARQSQQFERIVDYRQECQAIADQLIYEPFNQWNQKYLNSLVEKYFSLLSQVQDLKQLQVLVNLFPVQFSNVQTSIHNIKSHLPKALILEKYQQYGEAYESLLNHINQTYFSVKSAITLSKSQPYESKFTFSSNLKEIFLKLIRICQIDYWKNRNPLNYIQLLKQAQDFVLYSFGNELLSEFDDTIIDFMLIVMTKICYNLRPVAIYHQIFVKKSIQLQSQIWKQFYLQFVKHCQFYTHYYKIAVKSFEIDKKKKFRQERQMRRKGISIRKNCNFCQLTLEEECSVIIYGCGHRFHSYCDNHQAYCEECSYISDSHLFEKIIFQKEWQNGPQVLGIVQRKNMQQRKEDNKKKDLEEQKKQKIYQIHRKFKMYDYEVYTQQKTSLDPMKEWDSIKFN